jgi:hypothetical protein
MKKKPNYIITIMLHYLSKYMTKIASYLVDLVGERMKAHDSWSKEK